MAEQLEPPSTSGKWANGYRDRWKWDKTAWGSHCVDCYPTNCSYRVYVRDGRVVREEPAGNFQTIEEGVPDMNPTRLPEGRPMEPDALRQGACAPSAAAHRGARRGQLRARLLGRGPDRDRRRHAGRHPGVGPRVDRAHRHAGGGRHADHDAGRRRLQPPGRHVDRRAVRDQRLQPGPLHHVRALRPGAQQRRLVPLRAAAHLGQQPGLRLHPLVPLHRRGPLQRQRGRHHRARLQPLGHPRRLLRTRAHRLRRGPGPVDVPSHRRRGPRGRGLRARADRPRPAGAGRQRPLPAPVRPPARTAPTASSTSSTPAAARSPRRRERSISASWSRLWKGATAPR